MPRVEIVLDGEIVVLDKEGMPSFQNHQRRMNVDNKARYRKAVSRDTCNILYF